MNILNMDMMTYTNFLLYVVLWWLMLFMVLPWGLKPVVDPKLAHLPDYVPQVKPRLPLKFLITTVLTYGVWTVVKWIIAEDVLGTGY